MQVDAVGQVPDLPASARSGDKIKDAATQFESLLIGQLLKSVRDSGGWLSSAGDGDQAGATMLEVAEQHLAQVLAAQGGLGLASMVIEGLEAQKPAPPVR